MTVSDVTRRIGLGQRRLIQVFRAEGGLAPKLFCRVQRFQRARALARQSAAPNWARLGVECGYFDRAHLIRDVLPCASLSPTSYLRQQGLHLKRNHQPLAEQHHIFPIQAPLAAAE